jgi:hypothetical protein
MSTISSSEILPTNNIKEKFLEKINDLIPRLKQVLTNLNLDENIESFSKIFDNLLLIQNEIEKLENNLDIDSIENNEERNRIIDQKILKLFTPFICYYKLCLMQNNN